MTKKKRDELQRWSGQLGNHRTNSLAQRVKTLRLLVSLGKWAGEPNAVEGRAIASYLAVNKSEKEHREVMDALPVIGRWKHVKLGLADELPEATLRKDWMQSVLSQLLKRKVVLARGEEWRKSMGRQLLEMVYADLPQYEKSPGAPEASPVYDRAAIALRDLYRARGQLLGATLDDSSSAKTPSAALALAIDQLAARLSVGAVGAEQKQWLDQLPHELAVVEYLGRNDLLRTVILQRIWARMMAIDIAQRWPDRADAAAALATSLEDLHAESADAASQLRDGETIALQMSMLQAPQLRFPVDQYAGRAG